MCCQKIRVLGPLQTLYTVHGPIWSCDLSGSEIIRRMGLVVLVFVVHRKSEHLVEVRCTLTLVPAGFDASARASCSSDPTLNSSTSLLAQATYATIDSSARCHVVSCQQMIPKINENVMRMRTCTTCMRMCLPSKLCH